MNYYASEPHQTMLHQSDADDSNSDGKIPEFVFVSNKAATELDDVSAMDFSERSPPVHHDVDCKPFSWCLHSRQNDSLKMNLPAAVYNSRRTSQTSSKRLPSLPQRRASMNAGCSSTIGSGSADIIGDILLEAEAILSDSSDLFSLEDFQISSDDEDTEEEDEPCVPCQKRVSGGKIPVRPQRKASFDGCTRRGCFADDEASKEDLFAHGAKDARPPRLPQRKYLSPKRGQSTERKYTESFALPKVRTNPTKVMASTA